MNYLFVLIPLSVAAINAQLGCIGEDEICSRCKCSKYVEQVTCKKLNSTDSLLILPQNLTILKIMQCDIKVLDNGLFKNCLLLKSLSLIGNNLTTISSDLFRDLNSSLETLTIVNNPQLNLSKDLNIFLPLGKTLTNLNISGVPPVPQQIFEPLEKLVTLKLDGKVTNRQFGESFAKLVSLKNLYLKSFSDRISDDTFKNLNCCKTLHLRRAMILGIDPNAFSYLKNLTFLDLSYNDKMNLSMVTPSLQSLSESIRELHLSFMIGPLFPDPTLPENLFRILSTKPHLTHLFLTKNELLHFNWRINETLRHLKYIDISYNRFSNVFYTVTKFFMMSNLETIKADFQSKRYPGPKDDISDYSKHRDLEMYSRDISTRPDMQVVDFDDGDNINNNSDDGNEDNIYGGKGEDDGGDDHNMDEEEDDNEVEENESCNIKKGQRKNQYRSRGHVTCKFPSDPAIGSLDRINWCVPCPKNLRVGKFNSIVNINFPHMPNILVLGDCPLEKLYFQRNGLIYGLGQIMIDRPTAKKPMLIDLSFNGMQCISPNILKFSIERNITLGTLILEGNSLSNQLKTDSKGRVFHLYRDLKILNLADNRIKVLHENVFSNLVKLEMLNLSRNSLQVLHFNVSELPKLRFLDLSENLFISIDPGQQAIFTHMSFVHGYGRFIVSFVDNPLQCSCTTINFLNWIISNVTKIYNFRKLSCLYYKEYKNLSHTRYLSKYLMLYCYAALPLKIAGGLLGLAMLCGLVIAIVHKYRWDIRYYMLKRAQSKRRRHLSTSSNVYYLYDAFVCYDKGDRLWVMKELLVNLENPECNFTNRSEELHTSDSEPLLVDYKNVTPGHPCPGTAVESTIHQNRHPVNDTTRSEGESNVTENGLQLCVHERDFEPGCDIKMNIVTALENSRKVILVVSNKFLQSKWCGLELELAKMECLVRGVNLVVTIFLEPVDDPKESLEWLTKYFTYLEWFQYDEYRRHEFWRRLRVSLGRRRTRPDISVANS